MARDPHLAQQRGPQQRIEARPRLGKLEHDLARGLPILRTKDAHVLAVGQHLAEFVAVDDVAAHRRTPQRLLGDCDLQVGELRRRQCEDIEHDGGGVVRIGADRGPLDELQRRLAPAPRVSRAAHISLLTGRRARRRCTAGSDHAGARFPEVIHPQAVLRTDGARQRVRSARRTQRVVGREQGQHVVASR